MTTETTNNERSREATCSACRFFDRFYSSCSSGFCRRSPPRIIGKHEDGDWMANWPTVDDDDWCGEYQPNTKGEVQP
jgi:hypothetical protein